MKTYDEISTQLSQKEREQSEARHEACATLEALDAQLVPFKEKLENMEAFRLKILTPWTYTDDRRAHRYLLDPSDPEPRYLDSRAWARAVGGEVRVWTVDLSHLDGNFTQIETTRSTDLAGWDELLRQADEALIPLGYILLHTDADVKKAIHRYWPSAPAAKETP